jgi:hypothetical protein
MPGVDDAGFDAAGFDDAGVDATSEDFDSGIVAEEEDPPDFDLSPQEATEIEEIPEGKAVDAPATGGKGVDAPATGGKGVDFDPFAGLNARGEQAALGLGIFGPQSAPAGLAYAQAISDKQSDVNVAYDPLELQLGQPGKDVELNLWGRPVPQLTLIDAG